MFRVASFGNPKGDDASGKSCECAMREINSLEFSAGIFQTREIARSAGASRLDVSRDG